MTLLRFELSSIPLAAGMPPPPPASGRARRSRRRRRRADDAASALLMILAAHGAEVKTRFLHCRSRRHGSIVGAKAAAASRRRDAGIARDGLRRGSCAFARRW